MNFGKNLGFFEKVKSRGVPRITRREFFRGLLCAAMSFFMGICPLPLSVYPLGIAFFCAASQGAIYAAAGLFIASLCTPLNPTVYFLSSLLAVGLRVLTRLFIDVPMRSEDKPRFSLLFDYVNGTFFCEALPLRVAAAAVSVFALSLYPIISGGFRYYDLFGAIFSIVVTSVAVLLFYGAFSHRENEGEGFRYAALYKKAARIALSGALCLSLSSVPLRGVELGLAAAFVLVNHFCLSDGLFESCVLALVCGAVCGVVNIPVLVVVAFTAYCVLDASPTLAAAVSCIAGSVCGVMIEGSTYMTDPFLSLLLGCAVYATLKKLIAEKGEARTETLRHSHTELTKEVKLAHIESYMGIAEKTLSSLGRNFVHAGFAAEVLGAIESEAAEESEENKQLSRTLSRRLYELGFGRVECTAVGRRQVKIFLCGERLLGKPERLDFIRRRLEALTAFPLARPRIIDGTEGSTLVINRENIISYHHAVAFSAREEVCGDTAKVFLDEKRSMLYALICDGMGSGESASEISKRAAETLSVLLLCGLSPNRALSVLGAWLAEESGEENSTTVDLMALDLYSGKATLYKSGAAPSYVVRGGEIIRLSARTVPVGILKKADIREIDFDLREGDLLIMVSDGVSECENDSLPLLDYLNTHKSAMPDDITADIINLSRENLRDDDLTALAIKIFPQNY